MTMPAEGPPLAEPIPGAQRWLARAAYVAPILLLLAWWALPLATGARTLYLRDVFNTHLPMKAAHAAALRAGEFLPLVDPYRAGGQPLLGNPNAVPLYPDNLLYLFTPVLWALNAHFWLHFLLAPLAMYWLGRAWGLPRRSAWVGGVIYALCGFTLSTLNFYNLIGATPLVPAFVAAVLDARKALDPRRRAALVGALWALLLLAGEPLLAGLALGLAVIARGVLGPRHKLERADLWLTAAVLLGTAVAAPQWVELWRILPQSLRGWRGYARDAGNIGSLDPRQMLDWLLPFPYGRGDLLRGGAFWGERFYAGKPPLFFSLYPGILAAGLVTVSGSPRRRPAAIWAWIVTLLGAFVALGAWNPLARPLFQLGVLRYPIKFWLMAAIGLSLLAALGWERAMTGERPAAARLGWLLRIWALAVAGAWLAFSAFPAAAGSLLRLLVPAERPDAFVAGERLRWAGTLLLSLVIALALLAVLRASRAPRRAWMSGLLLAVHASGQAVLLYPLLRADETAAYVTSPAMLAAVPESALAAHGEFLDLFGPGSLAAGDPPVNDLRDLERRAFARLYPASGVSLGRRFELDTSAEGLDSYLAWAAEKAVNRMPDASRVWLLRDWAIDRLVLGRPLDPAAAALVLPPQVVTGDGEPMYVYSIREPVEPVRFVGTVLPAVDINVALNAMVRPEFDARSTAVVAGAGKPESGAGGTVTVRERTRERVAVEVHARSAGLLVIDRAYLPIYRARVDGTEVELEVTNLYRLGVRVPVGEHTVVVETDRRPTHAAVGGSGAGVLGLLALTWRRRRSAAPGADVHG